VAKNLPKNDFQKSSKVADFQQENHPGQNPAFSAGSLCPIVTGLCRVPDYAELLSNQFAIPWVSFVVNSTANFDMSIPSAS
jgi:hypothetical protein